MLQRALSGIVFVLVLIGAILYSSVTFYLLFFFLMIVAVYEFQKMSNYKSSYLYLLAAISYVTSSGSITILNKYLNVGYSNTSVTSAVGFVAVFCCFLIILFKQKEKNPFASLGQLFLTYIYAIVPFSILLAIPFCNQNQEYLGSTFLGCIVLIWSTDTFAYLTGRAIGKNKLYPRISPNKTIEGSVGGLLFTLITAGIISHFYTQYSLYEWLGLSLVISIFGGLGDLVESMFKRAANIKDSGNLMPGHGGVLDRFDSLIFAAPFIYYYLQLIS